ncbi:MAG: hypothetical protein ACRCVG_04245 [Methanobacteriaceae archaeon]
MVSADNNSSNNNSFNGSSDLLDSEPDSNFTANFNKTSTNSTFDFIKSDNNTFYGFCLDEDKNSPYYSEYYNVTSDTSSINGSITELLVRYYRYNNTAFQNWAIQEAIWVVNSKSLSSVSSNYRNTTAEMLNSLTGLVVGNNYDYIEGDTVYSFKIFLGENNEYIDKIINVVGKGNETVGYLQRVILFEYTTSNVTTPTNNTTNETPNNNSSTPVNNSTGTTPNKKNIPKANITENITNVEITDKIPAIAKAAAVDMQKTGIPIILCILVLSILGISFKRRK